MLSGIGRGVVDSYAVFLVPLSLAFGWDRTAAASVYGVLLLFVGMSSPIVGRIFDRWGPGRLNVLGVGALAVGTLLAGTLTHLWQFYLVLGVLCGFGASAISVVAQAALLTRWYHARLTTALAVVSAVAGLGVLIIAPLAQFLIAETGWRNAYFSLGALLLVVLAGVAMLPWRAIAAGDSAAPAADRASVPAGSGFTLRKALRTQAFWGLCCVHFLTANGMFAINPQIVAFLVDIDFSPMVAASAFGLAGAATTAGLLVFGFVADRYGKMLSITISYGMTLAGFVVMAAMQHYPVGWLLVVFILLYGPSFGSRGPIIAAITAAIFGRGPNLGTIMGAVTLGLGTGAAIGSTLGGLLHDWSGGYDLVAGYAFTTVFGAMMIFWLVPELRRH